MCFILHCFQVVQYNTPSKLSFYSYSKHQSEPVDPILLTILWIIQVPYEKYILGKGLQKTKMKNTKLAPEKSLIAKGYSLI